MYARPGRRRGRRKRQYVDGYERLFTSSWPRGWRPRQRGLKLGPNES